MYTDETPLNESAKENNEDDKRSTSTESSDQPKKEYRKYLPKTGVADFYKENHTNQTYDFNKDIRQKILTLGRWKLEILEVISLLDDISDKSDPDTRKKQLIHAIQTGEACRSFYPDKDWFHLMGFIHDLGKILSHPKMHNLPQWTVVGDTFPVGCAFDEKIVFYDFLKENPDSSHDVYKTKLGVYNEKCGFDNLLMSFGHDEYLYQVLKNNICLLPEEALYVIRYHSFYPWHHEGSYDYFANEKDLVLLPLLKAFQKCDLYSKVNVDLDVKAILPYYQDLITKYFPSGCLNW